MNFARAGFVVFSFSLVFFVLDTYGSGTYHPPIHASRGVYEFSHEDIKRGKELFEGNQLLGPGGKTCYSCHGKGRPVPLTRSSLKKKADQLGIIINNCLTDPTRSAGKRLELGSPQMVQLGVYLISRYRLPHKTIQYLKTR